MKTVHAEWCAANGWIVPTPARWPIRAFIAAQMLANLHHIRLHTNTTNPADGRYG